MDDLVGSVLVEDFTVIAGKNRQARTADACWDDDLSSA
jgi:hypothetical protein